MESASVSVQWLHLAVRSLHPDAVSRIVGESPHRVLAVCEKYVDIGCGLADHSEVMALAIDETSRARGHTHSTLITSQLPIKAWHTYLDAPTLADAILDRIVHSSHCIDLKGATLRENKRITRVDSIPVIVTA